MSCKFRAVGNIWKLAHLRFSRSHYQSQGGEDRNPVPLFLLQTTPCRQFLRSAKSRRSRCLLLKEAWRRRRSGPASSHSLLSPRICSPECLVRELECRCLVAPTLLLLGLIKTKAAIGLPLPESNPASKPCRGDQG